MHSVITQPADMLEAVRALPSDWHGSGSLSYPVLKALSELPPVKFSVETGTGKSTLLFSNSSQEHVVFTQDDRGNGDSLDRVRNSSLIGNVRFIVGPTQLTLKHYAFDRLIDIAFIDGPHGYPFPELEYYFLYPHIALGGWLIVDDIHIPTVTRLFEFLREDAMWELVKVVETTAFFLRTSAETFDPLADGWWLQEFNKGRFPDFRFSRVGMWARLKSLVPKRLRNYWNRQKLPA